MSGKNKKLIIIDAHALIHRAYHALPPLTTKGGELVNAVYGFLSILIKVIKEIKPDYILAAFDLPEPTFRHIEYKEYKATRMKAPDELYQQIPRVKEALRYFNIPIYEKAGFEADDIIGTIAKKAEKQKDLETIIVSGDMDTLQLVSKNIKVYGLRKGLSDTIMYDEEEVKNKFGLLPSQLPDFKGLKGDQSDNIPGVPGIGEKTATDLLSRFSSLENLYKNLDKKIKKGEIKESIALKLKENEEQAFFSRKLGTINSHTPIDFKLAQVKFSFFNKEKIEELFNSLGFYSLLPRIKEISPDMKIAKSEKKEKKSKDKKREEKIQSLAPLSEKIKGRNEFIKNKEKFNKKDKFYFLIGEDKIFLNINNEIFVLNISDIVELKYLFENPNIFKIGFDLKGVIKFLTKKGIDLSYPYFDVMIGAYVLSAGERDYGLKRIAFQYLKENLTELEGDDLFLKAINFLPKIEEIIFKNIKDNFSEDIFLKIEIPLIKVLANMEITGVKINSAMLSDLSKKIKKRILSLENNIYKIAGEKFNINSPKQLSNIIFQKLDIGAGAIKKTAKGTGLTTRASELLKLKGEHKIIEYILEYRELAKLKSTYLDALPSLVDKKTGRLHTSFNQTGTSTGRLSSQDPNLQNIPIRTDFGKEVRNAFITERDWKIISFDYSQIELRVVASISSDKKMIEAFKNNADIHALTAAEINNVSYKDVTPEMRRQAKALNFGIIYGMGSFGFAEAAGISQEKARKFIKEYFEDFSGIARYMEETKNQALKFGYVSTLLGRRRYIPEIKSSNWQVKNQAERMAVNMPIQGTAADIIKLAMIEIFNKFKNDKEIKMILQVHDELLFEAKKEKIDFYLKEIKNIMENIFQLKVPIKVNISVGDSWGKLEPLSL